MSMAIQAHAYRAIGVLLGGPFAPQRSMQPKPVVCALLRSRDRLVEAAVQVHATGSASLITHRAVGHHG